MAQIDGQSTARGRTCQAKRARLVDPALDLPARLGESADQRIFAVCEGGHKIIVLVGPRLPDSFSTVTPSRSSKAWNFLAEARSLAVTFSPARAFSTRRLLASDAEMNGVHPAQMDAALVERTIFGSNPNLAARAPRLAGSPG
jgi:hypothetical protein